MAKAHYVCQECGHHSAQWLGKCPACGNWNTLVEEADDSSGGEEKRRGGVSEDRLKKISESKRTRPGLKSTKPQKIKDLDSQVETRWNTGIGELDRVLGGGMVEGSFLLLGGDPGIGKSTLLLQALEKMAQTKKVLYVTGEESVEQVKLRAERLLVKGEDLYLASETNFEKILGMVEETGPDILAIDSIQTMFTSEITSAPGSVAQVREVGARLMHVAKKAGVVVIMIGHVTKDGTIAGPRVLEHMVDTVLQFESVGGQSFRILRAIKNRFGSTNEIGVFDMGEEGMKEVGNPSELFLAERPKGAPGSVVVSSMEGSRPLLVELQALVSRSVLGNPRRTVLGVDLARASILLAVLEKRIGLELYDKDVYLNVVGGFELSEPSADLGMVAAIASSFHNIAIPADTMFIGEIGLTGEVRSVTRVEDRLREAAVMGFKRCYLPERNAKMLKDKARGIELIPVKQVRDLTDQLFKA
ncbi:MAG: DNA repair protein RadA [Bacteriovoracia bacterium]